MAITIDGHAASYFVSTSITRTISITTTKTNDLILVFVVCPSNSVTATIADNAGLSWHSRSYPVFGAETTILFWAVSPGVLTNDTVTISFSTSVESAALNINLNGANNSSPFDPNASLPAAASAGLGSTSVSVTISTSNANDIIIAFFYVGGVGHVYTAGAGFTILDANGSITFQVGDEYKIVSAVQTNLSVSVSWTTGATGSEIWADAIKQAAPPPPPPPSSPTSPPSIGNKSVRSHLEEGVGRTPKRNNPFH